MSGYHWLHNNPCEILNENRCSRSGTEASFTFLQFPVLITMPSLLYTRGSQILLRSPRCGAQLVLWEGSIVVSRDIFIYNKVWTKESLYILVDTLVEIFYLPLIAGTCSEL
jgi:hypothetical protein